MDAITQSKIHDLFHQCKEKSIQLRSSTASDRRKKLSRLESWILAHRNDIRKSLYEDLKKSPQEADLSEIFVVLSEIRKARRKVSQWMGPRSAGTSLVYLGTRAETYFEPKGACLIIAPWNYPFQLAISPLVSAIAAGNTAIIKPSEFTENTSLLIERMCNEIFEKDEAAVVIGGINEAKELTSLKFDHIFFTGSPQVGKLVMEAASKHLTSVTLELGGKSPTIVDESARIKDAATKIAWGKWMNAGQTCIAPDYLMVHESAKEKLIEELIVQSEKIYGKEGNYGRIINREHHNRINDFMADAIEKGADLEFGGKSDRKNLGFTPTVISNVSMDSRVMTEEIFGPILPIITFNHLDEVIDIINEKEKPLALYIYSKRRKNINRIKKETSSGMLAINDNVIQFTHPDLPSGGVNNSGIGKSHGHYGFLEFSNQKSLLYQRTGFTMSKLVYPPINSFKKLLIDFIIKYF